MNYINIEVIKIKTKETLQLENNIWKVMTQRDYFSCLEVTIGNFGHERVDMLSYNNKGIWRCFEIKVSKSDFYSKAHKTFVGNYNYYVMPKSLYDIVKNEIPDNVGVWIDGENCVKKSKKQQLGIDEQILKDSMIRSLFRDVNKQKQDNDEFLIDYYKREIYKLQKNNDEYRERYFKLFHWIFKKFGSELAFKILKGEI